MQSLTKVLAKATSTLAVTAVALGVLVVPAVAAPEWNTSGHRSWGSCAVVDYAVDETTLPAGATLSSVLEDLRAAAEMINNEVGRTLVTISSTPVVGDTRTDGINTVWFRDGMGAAGMARQSTAIADNGDVRYVDAAIMLDRASWVGRDVRSRRLTVAHEMGHNLGLGHVADAHEIMSYGFLDDGDGLGEGTSHALRELYTGADCAATPRVDGSLDFATGRRATVIGGSIGATATDVRDLAVDALRYRETKTNKGDHWAARGIVCRDDLFADCLGGSALVGTDGILLLVPGGADGTLAASDRTTVNLAAALKPGAPVYVLGGVNAVSPAVVSTLSATHQVTRIAGETRYETAAQVAREVARVHGAPALAMIARGDNPADAVAAGAIAARKGYPILLTPQTDLGPAAASALSDLGVQRTLVLGGEAALSAKVADSLRHRGHHVERVAGATRAGTAVAIAEHTELWNRTRLDDGQAVVGLNGHHPQMWALALAAVSFSAAVEAPVLLTNRDDVPTETAEYLLGLEGSGTARAVFVGAGNWAGEHAAASFVQYASIG